MKLKIFYSTIAFLIVATLLAVIFGTLAERTTTSLPDPQDSAQNKCVIQSVAEASFADDVKGLGYARPQANTFLIWNRDKNKIEEVFFNAEKKIATHQEIGLLCDTPFNCIPKSEGGYPTVIENVSRTGESLQIVTKFEKKLNTFWALYSADKTLNYFAPPVTCLEKSITQLIKPIDATELFFVAPKSIYLAAPLNAYFSHLNLGLDPQAIMVPLDGDMVEVNSCPSMYSSIEIADVKQIEKQLFILLKKNQTFYRVATWDKTNGFKPLMAWQELKSLNVKIGDDHRLVVDHTDFWGTNNKVEVYDYIKGSAIDIPNEMTQVLNMQKNFTLIRMKSFFRSSLGIWTDKYIEKLDLNFDAPFISYLSESTFSVLSVKNNKAQEVVYSCAL